MLSKNQNGKIRTYRRHHSNFVIDTLNKAARTAGLKMPKIKWTCLKKIMTFLVPDDDLHVNETRSLADMCDRFGVPECGANHRALSDAKRATLLLSVAIPLLAVRGVTNEEHLDAKVLKTGESCRLAAATAANHLLHAIEVTRQMAILRSELAMTEKQKQYQSFVTEEAWLKHVLETCTVCLFQSDSDCGALLAVRPCPTPHSNLCKTGVANSACLQMIVRAQSDRGSTRIYRTPSPDGMQYYYY